MPILQAAPLQVPYLHRKAKGKAAGETKAGLRLKAILPFRNSLLPRNHCTEEQVQAQIARPKCPIAPSLHPASGRNGAKSPALRHVLECCSQFHPTVPESSPCGDRPIQSRCQMGFQRGFLIPVNE
jgi:hypothetical protein